VVCQKANRPEGRGIGSKPVRHDPAWREAVLLEKLHRTANDFGWKAMTLEVQFDHAPIILPLT
jgi:transposase